MQYQPEHAQPFTIQEASGLEIEVIVAEIARLRNSISHLSDSQDQLLTYLKEEEEDPDIRTAVVENETVIAAQKERIMMLRSVLASKVGEDALAHYGIEPIGAETSVSAAAPTSTPTSSTTATSTTGALPIESHNGNADPDEGMHL